MLTIINILVNTCKYPIWRNSSQISHHQGATKKLVSRKFSWRPRKAAFEAMIRAHKRSKYGECAKVVKQLLTLSARNSSVPQSWGAHAGER